MRNLLFAISTILIAACGTANTSDIASKNDTTGDTVTLGAGDYLFTFKADYPCQAGEFNLEKTTTVTTFIPTVSFHPANQVGDNLIRPQACLQFPAPSFKTERVSLSTLTHVYAVDMKIVSIEKITRSVVLRLASLPVHTLDAGRYVLHITGYDSCNAGERNVVKSLHFNEKTAEFEEVRMSLGSPVTDDLIRAAVCRPGSTLAETYIEVDGLTQVATPQDNTTFGLEIIGETEPLDLAKLRN